MGPSSPIDFVTLKGGLVIAMPALELLWELAHAGFTVERIGDRLRVLPASRLTPDLAARIRQHRDAVLALVDYVETVQ